VLAVAWLLGVAPKAAADGSREAEALIREGVQLRAQGKDERALPLFEKAYQESRTPRTAGQLGLVELAVGYFVDAERYLSEALASPDHPWVAKNLKMLQEQLASAKDKIGELAISGTPAGAEVWINGKRVGQLPLAAPVRLDKGRATVELRAPGYVASSDTLTISGGTREARTYALTREAVAPPPPVAETPAPTPPLSPVSPAAPSAPAARAPPPLAPLPAGAGAPDALHPPTVVVVAPPPRASSPGSVARPLAWVAAGAAVAGIAVGAAQALVASSKRDEFNGHTSTINGVATLDCATTALNTMCRTIKDDHDRAVTFSIIGFAAGGALAIASATLFVLSTPGDTSAASHQVACATHLGNWGLSCSLHF
jgi:hypothetical protein